MFSGNFTKLLVSSGLIDEATVEIIDLSDENLVCKPLTNFPTDPYEPGKTFYM